MSKAFNMVRAAALGGIAWTALQPALAMAQEGSNQLQEIVVTAQKREESLNRVGLTVAALGGEALKDRQISSLQDLTQAVPSLTYANSPTGTPVISLRGVGYFETSLAAYPTVSLYLDQVAFPFPVMAAHANFDLERVEVLKGPQGTLFGQNATGGAINFIAAKPTDEFHAGIQLGYGRFNAVTEEGYVSGALSDTVSARVAQRVEFADGWQKSLSRPGDRNGKLDNVMGRVQLDFHPSDTVKFLLNLNGWKDQSDPQAAQFIGINTQIPGFLNPVVAATPFAPSKPRAADWNQGLPQRDNSFWQASLRGDIEFGGLTLTSLTAYSRYKQKQAEDFDGLPVSQDDFTTDDGKITSFSQELRLANDPASQFRWMIGGNYERSKVNQFFDYNYGYASTNGLLGIVSNQFGSDQKMRSAAAFGNVEFDVAEAVTLKAGIRYTDSKISATDCGTDLTPPYIVGNLFYDIIAGGLSGPYTPGRCFAINDLGTTVNGIAPFQPGRFKGTLKEDNVSWRVGVDWKVAPDALIYANVAKGYKSGNFPTVGASVFSQYLPVTQESVLAYEAGFKVTLLERRLQINGAGFYYDYKDKQLRSRTIDPIFGNLDVLQNIPESSVRGGEIEIVTKPFTGLTLSASATYIKAEIDHFSGINAAGLQADFSNTPVPFTPKYQANVSGDYVTPFFGDFDLIAGFTVSHRSKTSAIIGGAANPPGAIPAGDPLFRIKDYTLVDMRLGVQNANWKVLLWGKNVFNTYYWNNVGPAFDSITRYTGQPATYGVTVGYRF